MLNLNEFDTVAASAGGCQTTENVRTKDVNKLNNGGINQRIIELKQRAQEYEKKTGHSYFEHKYYDSDFLSHE